MSTAVTPVLENDQWRRDLAKSIDADMRAEQRTEPYHWLKVAKSCGAVSEFELFALLGFKSFAAWLRSLPNTKRSRAYEAINLRAAFAYASESDLLEISKENLTLLADQPEAVRCDRIVLAKARVLNSCELRKHLGIEIESARLNVTVPSSATVAVKFAMEVAAVFGEPGLHPLHKIALRYLQSPCDVPGFEGLSMEQAFAQVSE